MSESTLENFNTTIQGLIFILQFVLLILPFIGGRALYDGRATTKPFLERFSNRGRYFIGIGIILIVISFLQTRVASKLANIETHKKIKNDSLREEKNKNEIIGIGEKHAIMLAKFGLKVDTTKNEIVKILNKPKPQNTTIINGKSPFIEIFKITVDPETHRNVYLELTSYNATSYNVNTKIDSFGIVDDELFLLTSNDPVTNNLDITEGYKSMNDFRLDRPNATKISVFYFYLYGTYQKEDGTILKVEKYFGYDFSNSEGYKIPTKNIINEMQLLRNTK